MECTLERALGKFIPITAAFSCGFPLSSRFRRSRSLSTMYFFKKKFLLTALDLQRAGLGVQRETAQVHVAHGSDGDSARHTTVAVTVSHTAQEKGHWWHLVIKLQKSIGGVLSVGDYGEEQGSLRCWPSSSSLSFSCLPKGYCFSYITRRQ